MTDKLPRQIGGDGGGPDETPMERLLREAMNARATQITAHSLRPSAPPSSRVRRLRPAYIAAVPLFGLAAAVAVGVLAFNGGPVAKQEDPGPAATVPVTASPSPTAEPTTTPSATPSATASATATTTEEPGGAADPTPSGTPSATTTSATTQPNTPATPYTFRGVKFTVPAGWRVAPLRTAGSSTLCVLAPGAPQAATATDCSPYGAELSVYSTAEEVDHATWPTVDSGDLADGWTTQPYCPVWGNPHPIGGSDQLKNTTAPLRTRDIVAGRPVFKTQWQVSCNAKESFTAQLWSLKSDQVFLAAVGLKPEHQSGLVSILNTMDLSGRTAPQLKANQNDVAVSVDGLTSGQQVTTNGTTVSFSVTYKNTGQTSYASVQPLVYTEQYAGTPAGAVQINEGKLERLDGDVWKPLPLSPGGGMDYAMLGKDASFPLAPGQSRTVKYRMSLAATDGAGVMPVTARATLPFDGTGQLTVIGERSVPVRVVK
ncbi:hypothetical protein J5Y04_30275 [Kitasatospora sp. RG8]|uniref:hypothetical protein n=1 Tax=Kitasatospora sp. RG8 TaxID=2820815 RepID=UPI001AE09DCA|nr:hypothetical protein [Kitasatospora sp. RG8]MBP0453798.1 hypothetical protein [Kitasatospora sp. RG8]